MPEVRSSPAGTRSIPAGTGCGTGTERTRCSGDPGALWLGNGPRSRAGGWLGHGLAAKTQLGELSFPNFPKEPFPKPLSAGFALRRPRQMNDNH